MLKGEAKTRYMRDYMRRRRAGQPAKPKPAEPRSSPDVLAVKDQEIARLKSRIAELEAELARWRRGQEIFRPRTPEEWAALKLKVAEEKKARRAALRAARAAAAPAQEQEASAETLRAEVEKWKEEATKRNTRIANLKRQIRVMAAMSKGIPLTKEKHRLIRSCLHPYRAAGDAKMQKRLEQAFQAFEGLNLVFPDEP